MAVLHLIPLDDELPAAKGKTLMGAAQDAGYYWPTTCGGEGRCTTCACEVVAGAEALTPMGKSEQATLVEERGPAVLDSAVRLACQARIVQDARIVIRKPGVRRP